jgi:hypothetical protein
MKYLAGLLLLTSAACVSRVDGMQAADEPHVACEDEPSECAIQLHAERVGPLSEDCQDVVRATTIVLRYSSDIDAACPLKNGYEHVLGCMTGYSKDGAEVQVLHDSGYQNTATHELMHVALRCSRGNPDVSHTTYGLAWDGLLE